MDNTAEKIFAALANIQRANGALDLAWIEWRKIFVEETLKIAELLRNKKLKVYNNNPNTFNRYLEDTGLDKSINHNDRAALIHMGRYPDVSRTMLEVTKSRSWRLIWKSEIKPIIDNAQKSASNPNKRSPNAGKAQKQEKKDNGTTNPIKKDPIPTPPPPSPPKPADPAPKNPLRDHDPIPDWADDDDDIDGDEDFTQDPIPDPTPPVEPIRRRLNIPINILEKIEQHMKNVQREYGEIQIILGRYGPNIPALALQELYAALKHHRKNVQEGLELIKEIVPNADSPLPACHIVDAAYTKFKDQLAEDQSNPSNRDARS